MKILVKDTEVLEGVLRAEMDETRGLRDLGDGRITVVGTTKSGVDFFVGSVSTFLMHSDPRGFWRAVERVKFSSRGLR